MAVCPYSPSPRLTTAPDRERSDPGTSPPPVSRPTRTLHSLIAGTGSERIVGLPSGQRIGVHRPWEGTLVLCLTILWPRPATSTSPPRPAGWPGRSWWDANAEEYLDEHGDVPRSGRLLLVS